MFFVSPVRLHMCVYDTYGMQKIYQKLGRVRASHETMILGPWSVWSTYNVAQNSGVHQLIICQLSLSDGSDEKSH